jgi:hypothetical protein
MNVACFMLSLFSTPRICPDLRMFIASYPCKVRHAVAHEKKPIPSLTSRLMKRWSCSTRLLRYLLCRSSQGLGIIPSVLSSLPRFGIGRVFINRNDSRSAGMRRSKRFQEKALGCLSISCGTKKKFQGVSLGIDGAIQIHPRLFHFHIGLIDAPRVVRRFEMRSASFLQFRCVVLDPAIDRRVIDMQSSLCHHLLQISVAKRIPEVPAYTEQNNLGLKVTPFERVGGVHAIVSSQFSEYRRAYYILAVFATQPVCHPSCNCHPSHR